MPQIPIYNGGVRTRGLSEVSAGPRASAESFGAGRARDLQNFGGAVANLGEAGLRINEIKQTRIARTEVRDMFTGLDTEYREWEKEQLKNRKGMSAKNLDRDAEQWWTEKRRQLEPTLTSNRHKDLFGPQFDAKMQSAVDHMAGYSFKQVEIGEKLSRDAQNDDFILDSAVRGLLNDNLVADNRRLGHANIAANWGPYGKDVLEQKTREFDHALDTAMLESNAAVSPAKALEHLGKIEARQKAEKQTVFTPAEVKALREKYKKEEDTNQEIATGRTLFDMRDENGVPLSLDALYDEALKEFPDDQKKALKAAQFAVTFQASQAKERRALDQKAIETMAKSGWDVAAIDPTWPEDLQDKMLDRVLKRADAIDRREARLEKDARQARGLELLETPSVDLDRRILAGEWLAMEEAVGIGSPEHKALVSRVNGDNPGGRTMLQYAKDEFTKVFDSPTKNQKKYAEFIGRVNESRTELAMDLGLNDPNMIPNSKQKEVIDHWMMDGDFRWFESMPGFFSINKRRFQVEEEDLPGWKPFDAPATPSVDLPDFARPYLGPRDLRREALPNGSVLIESSNGKVTIVNPDGSLIEGTP